jgi:hypothetical protein
MSSAGTGKRSGMWVTVSNGVVISKDCRWWADRGMFHVEDARDNSYKSMTIRQALYHLNGLSDMLMNSGKETDYYDEIMALRTFCEQIREVIQRAKEQGDPTTKDAVEDRKRRARKVISLNKTFNSELSL